MREAVKSVSFPLAFLENEDYEKGRFGDFSFEKWWAMLDLNQRPPVCKTGALTAELIAQKWYAWWGLNPRPQPSQGCALIH